MDNLVLQVCPARHLAFSWRGPKMFVASVKIVSWRGDAVSAKAVHIWSLILTLSSSYVHRSSIELPQAIGVSKHKFLRKWLSVLWCESVMCVSSWMRSGIWSFAAPQDKEMSSWTTLESLNLGWNGHREGIIGVAVGFFRSFEFSQCFSEFGLFILLRTICSKCPS